MVLNSKTSSLAGLLVAAAVLYLAREVLIPLALAILLSFLLAPVVRRLEHWRLGRIPSTIIAVAVGSVQFGSHDVSLQPKRFPKHLAHLNFTGSPHASQARGIVVS